MTGFLSQDEQMILKEAHRVAQDKRHAYKINVILLLNEGWSYEQIAAALLLDETTARRYLKSYQRQGLDGLLENLYEGRDSKLDPDHQRPLGFLQNSKTGSAVGRCQYLDR